jgi:fructokinase
MKKILCIGEALIDMICTNRNRSLADGENFLKKAGGAPMNVAAAIGALGGDVLVAAKVGADPFGEHLTDVLNSFQVDTTHIIRDKAHFTTFAFVSLLENGERDFYFNRGADGMLTVNDVEAIQLESCGIIHFGSATGFLPGPLQEAYLHLLDKSKSLGKFISFDPNYRQLLFGDRQEEFISRSWHFMKQADFFKISDEEALLLTGKSTVYEAAEHFFQESKAVFAITLGKEGTLLGFQSAIHIIPSICINPVDTTGAGDAFVGAVLYQLSSLNSEAMANLDDTGWQEIILQANKAGARTCEYMGAMEAFKHLNKDIFKL